MYWIVGQTYLVSSSAGCTVQFADGAHVKTVPAGEPTLVVAQTHDMVVTDANATVRRMPNGCDLLLGEMFNGAPVGALPAGYTRCDFLEGTRAQWIDTGVKLSNESEVNIAYNIKQIGVNQPIFGTQTAWNENNFSILQHPKRVYAYCLATNTAGMVWQDGQHYEQRREMYVSSAYGRLDGIVVTNPAAAEIFETANSARLFTYDNFTPAYVKIYSFSLSRSGVRQLNYLPCLDPTGVPCMYDTVSKTPFYNTGSGVFVVGFTAAQAAQLANLPTGGGALTVSLPQSILNDEGEITDAAVRAALNKAADNGWTITLQYYNEQ